MSESTSTKQEVCLTGLVERGIISIGELYPRLKPKFTRPLHFISSTRMQTRRSVLKGRSRSIWLICIALSLLIWTGTRRSPHSFGTHHRTLDLRSSGLYHELSQLATNVSVRALEVVSSRIIPRHKDVIDRELSLQRGIKCYLPYHGLGDPLLATDCHFTNVSLSEYDMEDSKDSICSHLYGKTILLLGDRSQHALHNLLLDQYPIPTDPDNSVCPGADFCNWHPICLRTSSIPLSPQNPLPNPMEHPDRKKLLPPDRRHVSILRYVRTYSLFPTRNRKHRRHNEPYVSHITGIRESESYWVSSVRGADVVILSRAPVLAPTWSYMQDLGDKNSKYPRPFRLRNPEIGDWELEYVHHFKDVIPESFYNSTFNSAFDVSAAEIIYSAVRATVDVWVPTLVSTLVIILSDPGMHSKRFIWRGEWGAIRRCGTDHLSIQSSSALDTLLGFHTHPDSLNDPVKDPWYSFHNSQGEGILMLFETLILNYYFYINPVIFQSLILSTLLPHLGITYLPLYHLNLTQTPVCPYDQAFLKSNAHLYEVRLPDEIGKAFIDTLGIALGW